MPGKKATIQQHKPSWYLCMLRCNKLKCVVRAINWDVIFFFFLTKITPNKHYCNYCCQHSTALCSCSYCPTRIWVRELAFFCNYYYSNGCIFSTPRNENCNLKKTPKPFIPVGFKRCHVVTPWSCSTLLSRWPQIYTDLLQKSLLSDTIPLTPFRPCYFYLCKNLLGRNTFDPSMFVTTAFYKTKPKPHVLQINCGKLFN